MGDILNFTSAVITRRILNWLRRIFWRRGKYLSVNEKIILNKLLHRVNMEIHKLEHIKSVIERVLLRE